MKAAIIISLTLITLGIGISACKKSQSYIPECSGVVSKFSINVSPLMTSRCATSSGCHASGSKKGPGALTTYSQIKNATSDIRKSIVSGSMPDDGTLTIDERNAIVCWIDAGANND